MNLECLTFSYTLPCLLSYTETRASQDYDAEDEEAMQEEEDTEEAVLGEVIWY